MVVCLVGSDMAKDEWLSAGVSADCEVLFASDLQHIPVVDLSAVIDLSFDDDPTRVASLSRLHTGVVVVNSVRVTLQDLPDHFVRINGWPGFLKRDIVEAAGKKEETKKAMTQLMHSFNKKIEWVADIPGFITARIVAAIINEAFFSLEEEVSSKTDIDIAMKMGTNYPYGPFEWGDKIGLKNVYELLNILSRSEKRYQPAPLLRTAALI